MGWLWGSVVVSYEELAGVEDAVLPLVSGEDLAALSLVVLEAVSDFESVFESESEDEPEPDEDELSLVPFLFSVGCLGRP